MVLDCVIRPTRQQLGNFRPSIPKARLGSKDQVRFVRAPRGFIDVGIEEIEPPRPALLGRPPRQEGGNVGPAFGPTVADKAHDHGIVLGRPGPALVRARAGPAHGKRVAPRSCARRHALHCRVAKRRLRQLGVWGGGWVARATA